MSTLLKFQCDESLMKAPLKTSKTKRYFFLTSDFFVTSVGGRCAIFFLFLCSCMLCFTRVRTDRKFSAVTSLCKLFNYITEYYQINYTTNILCNYNEKSLCIRILQLSMDKLLTDTISSICRLLLTERRGGDGLGSRQLIRLSSH